MVNFALAEKLFFRDYPGGSIRPSLECSKNLRVGYLPQDGVELPEKNVHEVLWDAFDELNQMETSMQACMKVVESTNTNDPEHERSLARYGVLQEEFQSRGGYSRESDAKKVLIGLGFEHSDWDRPVREFSGGWRMRVVLAKLLLQRPDIYLLDEPTNHLDGDSLAWFESYLNSTQAGMVVVSHDRYFLDRVVSAIGEIENRRFTLYPGTYSKYKVMKEERREQLLAERKKQEREIAHLQSFVDKNRADKRKAAQAQSRIKRIAKIELVEIETRGKTISIPLPETPRSGKEVLCLDSLAHNYDGLQALHPVTLNVYRGDRIAVWGANGAGKSTLLSLIAKRFEPTQGSVEWGYNTHVGYFSQHQAEMQNSTRSVIDELEAYAPVEMQSRLRDMLGAFLFSGDDVFKKVSVLSGGEKSRLAMATLLIRPLNVLIMDEPLNHLDIDTVESLERTLRDFGGTLIFVSHDRFFVDRLATQVWEMARGHLRVYLGNFKDYEYAKQLLEEQYQDNGSSSPDRIGDAANNAGEGNGNLTRQQRKELKRKEAEDRNKSRAIQREKEKKCESLEAEILAVEQEMDKMAAGDFIRVPTEMAKASKRYKTLQKNKEKLYKQWEKQMEAM